MATKIKICGLRQLSDADIINELRPDYAGVVLCRRFWRGIDFEAARALRYRINYNIPLVGVFVNDDFATVMRALRTGVVDMVQLQGTESEEYIRDLMIQSGKPVIKACQMDSPAVIPYAEYSAANHILFDSSIDDTFDWNMVRYVQRPYILSGGLNADNVCYALDELNPWGVNLSSGVETDGMLDPEKIRAAVRVIREHR